MTNPHPFGDITDEDLLAATISSIGQILIAGQSYSIDGRALSRADLPELRALRSELEARVNAAAGTSRNKSNLACMKRPT